MKKYFSWQNPLAGTVVLILLLILILYSSDKSGVTWLRDATPTIFGGFATLLVGLYVFLLYKKQKADIKKDAANILLLELQNAEKVLKSAQRGLEKQIPELASDAITIPTESWSKNKYLFIADFDNNQWEAISNFYNACALFDDAVKTNASYFQKNEEQIRVNIQKRASQLTVDYEAKIDKAKSSEGKLKLKAELRSKIEESTDLYLSGASEYRPVKPMQDAKASVETIKLNLSLPSAISKLKELAK